MFSPRKSDLFFLVTLLSASLGYNVYQTWRASPQESRLSSATSMLQRGDTVPPLQAMTRERRPITLGFDGQSRPTLVYVMSPGCGWCDANIENLKVLVNSLRGTHRIIVMETTRSDTTAHASIGGGHHLLIEPTEATKAGFKMFGVPQTIVVSNQGKVELATIGAYTGSIKKEVESFFSVALPGVVMKSNTASSGCVDEVGGSYSEGAVLELSGTMKQCRGGSWNDWPPATPGQAGR